AACGRGDDVARVRHVRTERRLVGLEVVETDETAGFGFRHPRRGRQLHEEPARLLLAHVGGQRPRLAGPEDGLDDAPYGGPVGLLVRADANGVRCAHACADSIPSTATGCGPAAAGRILSR